jgi:hypothetical protein
MIELDEAAALVQVVPAETALKIALACGRGRKATEIGT